MEVGSCRSNELVLLQYSEATIASITDNETERHLCTVYLHVAKEEVASFIQDSLKALFLTKCRV